MHAAGLSALRWPRVQLLGSRAWGVGVLASPGYSATHRMERNMKRAQTVSAPFGHKRVHLLAPGSFFE